MECYDEWPGKLRVMARIVLLSTLTAEGKERVK